MRLTSISDPNNAICSTCHQDVNLPRDHYTDCPDCNKWPRPGQSPEHLRLELARLGVRCAYSTCEQLAVGRDPRPYGVKAAFYYLCPEHLAVATSELNTPKRPYRVEYTVYVSATVAAATPEDALVLAREKGSMLATVSTQKEIAELRLVDCDEWPVPDSFTQWTPF